MQSASGAAKQHYITGKDPVSGSVGPSQCGQDWVGVACAAVGNRYGLDNSTWHGIHDAFMQTLGNYPLTSPPVSPN